MVEMSMLVKITHHFLFVTLFAVSINVFAQSERKDVRMYKINKYEQSTRLMFVRSKAKQAGCHNLLKRTRVHRLNQFGYAFCSTYTKRNCTPDSIVSAYHNKAPEQKETQLTEGLSWYLRGDHERGEKIRSWYCSDDAEKKTGAKK